MIRFTALYILMTGASVLLAVTNARAQEAEPAARSATTTSTVLPCIELPTGELTPEQLKELVPDDSGGRVFIRWRTETQDDNYGFNIYRADAADGPYKKINRGIIPGEGSTNIPKDYCYMDTQLPRGKTVFYYIESVSNAGVAEVVDGTKGTKVKVKTVEEEREWIRKKAAGIDTRAAQTTSSASGATTSATVVNAQSLTRTDKSGNITTTGPVTIHTGPSSALPAPNAAPNPLD